MESWEHPATISFLLDTPSPQDPLAGCGPCLPHHITSQPHMKNLIPVPLVIGAGLERWPIQTKTKPSPFCGLGDVSSPLTFVSCAGRSQIFQPSNPGTRV
jgi:hypothetical protein